jgi:hypothetical protein
MKSNSLITVLLGGLILVAVCAAYFLLSYNFAYRELRRLQPRVVAATNTRAVMQALAADLLEYSKRNQDIDPLLLTVGIKGGTTNALPATTPKPPSR